MKVPSAWEQISSKVGFKVFFYCVLKHNERIVRYAMLEFTIFLIKELGFCLEGVKLTHMQMKIDIVFKNLQVIL